MWEPCVDLMTAWQLDLCAIDKEFWVTNKLGFYFLLRSSSFFLKKRESRVNQVKVMEVSTDTHTKTDKIHTFP